MPNGFRINKAQIQGRDHSRNGVNCQDALNFGVIDMGGDSVYYGVICDGCSEGRDSEVGAKLAAAFIGQSIENLVRNRTAFFKIPGTIHKNVLGFLGNVLSEFRFDSQIARAEFISNKLLFTVIAFIMSKDQLMVFAQGDGVIVVNDEVQVRDANDKPLYLGYNLVDRRFLLEPATPLPTGFDTQFYETRTVSRFAIASDSLGHELLSIPSIWDNPKSMTLQKKINAMSWNDHQFKDDLSLIVVEKLPEGG